MMDNQKEWNFNFGVYANDSSFIKAEKCDELMDYIVKWIEKNKLSCGGGFSTYPENEYYDSLTNEEGLKKEEFCQCSSSSSMVMMSRYNKNPLSCFDCNGYIFFEKIKIDIEIIAKLQQWGRVYESIDRLWLESGVYESWAILELGNANSLVNKQGFEVQKVMQKYAKTYYWWFQDIGNTTFKPLINCPKCIEVLEKRDDKLICEKCLLVMQGEC